MKHFLVLLTLLFFIGGCDSDSASSSTSTTSNQQYVKETEVGLPLSVNATQTLLFNLEAKGDTHDLDSGEDGFDEYSLVIDKAESKQFCIGEDSASSLSLELYLNDTLIESITDTCKNIELKKATYTVKLLNLTDDGRLLHVEHRSSTNYKAITANTLTTSTSEQAKNFRDNFSDFYSTTYDSILFQTETCSSCNLYGIDLSHYTYGDFPSSSAALSADYLTTLGISYDELKAKYDDNIVLSNSSSYAYADLRDVNMSYSVFNNVGFTDNNMEGIDFSHSVFISCKFSGNYLKDANFDHAIFLDTEFSEFGEESIYVASKPSLSSMYTNVIVYENSGGFVDLEYSSTALAVLLNDGNIWIQPDINNETTYNITSVEGKRIASYPELTWWADIDVSNYGTAAGISSNIVYVVTDDGGLYYQEVNFTQSSGIFKISGDSTWTQINDDSTLCASAPIATSSFTKSDNVDDATVLSTQVNCVKEDGKYYKWSRSITYDYELMGEAFITEEVALLKSGTDSGYGAPNTYNTPNSNAVLSSVNDAGIELFIEEGSNNTIDTVTLAGNGNKSYTSSQLFGVSATSYIDIGSVAGSDDYFLTALNGSTLYTMQVNSSFFFEADVSSSTVDYYDFDVELISGVDIAYDTNSADNTYAGVVSNGNGMFIYTFSTDVWQRSSFPDATTTAWPTYAFENASFSNAYFGLSQKNDASDEPDVSDSAELAIPYEFSGADGIYYYNIKIAEGYTLSDFDGAVFDNVDLYHTVFTGSVDNVYLKDSTLTCNTLDDASFSNWSMDNTIWQTESGCFNSAKNASLDASMLAPTLSGDELLKFDLSDAQNIKGFSAIDFSSKDMSKITMTYADLSGSEGNFTKLSNSIWSDASINNLTCNYCDLEDAAMVVESAQNMLFSNSYLVGLSIGGDFTNSTFTDSQIDGIQVNASTSLNLASFTNVTTNGLIPNHTECTFDSANLSGATFSGVYLQDCSFNGANLSAAKTLNNSTFVQNDFANSIYSSGTFGLSESAFYGSCFDGISSTDVTQVDTTFNSDGSVNTSLVYDLRDGTTYDGIDVTYKLIDGCSNYQPN